MYNENQKKRYIKYKKSITILPEGYLETQFKFSEDYEKELGKDLCNFNEEEIKEFYKIRNFVAAETIYTINSQLKDYTNWCNSQGLVKDHQNHYSFLTSDDLKICVNRLKAREGIVTREELIRKINKLENACDKYIFLALFEGIKGKECSDLTNITCEHINGNMVKLNSGKEVEISKQLKDLIYQSCETYVYYTKTRQLELVGNMVIKNRPNVKTINQFRLSKRLYTTFNRIKLSIGLDYTSINSIFMSGKYEFVKKIYDEAKKENPNIKLDDFIKANREVIESRYDKIPSVKSLVESIEEYLM